MSGTGKSKLSAGLSSARKFKERFVALLTSVDCCSVLVATGVEALMIAGVSRLLFESLQCMGGSGGGNFSDLASVRGR